MKRMTVYCTKDDLKDYDYNMNEMFKEWIVIEFDDNSRPFYHCSYSKRVFACRTADYKTKETGRVYFAIPETLVEFELYR